VPDFSVETARLVLRDWQEQDWPEFFRLTNTPSVMRWLGGVMDDERRGAQRNRIETVRRNHGHCFWVIERQSDGRHLSGAMLGFCGLKRCDAPASTTPGEFEIGWRMRDDAWGHGYAREAAEASLRAGFEQFGAERIVAVTVPQNRASWTLMRRLGMVRREDLDYIDDRFDDELRNAIVYSISREEWLSR
jgi:RimJ/RimL family protein N-acetyltransferase